jgi:hypothetical protein
VLVLGIGYFVKFAIDQNWIGIYGRVFIGILCGGILLGLAHWLRKSFAAFSSVLVGGGIAVLYLTIAIAFHEYQIFSQTMAFILMVIITGFTILLAIRYNRVELAVLAILGGFSSPFMVSTGEGNYVVLFIYVMILDVGMLVLAYYKRWSLVNIVSYAFTLILFGSWLGTKFESWNGSMVQGALLFATLFYLIFFAMNIVNNIRENTKFKALEITLLLSNTFFYYTVGMVILSGEANEDVSRFIYGSVRRIQFHLCLSVIQESACRPQPDLYADRVGAHVHQFSGSYSTGRKLHHTFLGCRSCVAALAFTEVRDYAHEIRIGYCYAADADQPGDGLEDFVF